MSRRAIVCLVSILGVCQLRTLEAKLLKPERSASFLATGSERSKPDFSKVETQLEVVNETLADVDAIVEYVNGTVDDVFAKVNEGLSAATSSLETVKTAAETMAAFGGAGAAQWMVQFSESMGDLVQQSQDTLNANAEDVYQVLADNVLKFALIRNQTRDQFRDAMDQITETAETQDVSIVDASFLQKAGKIWPFGSDGASTGALKRQVAQDAVTAQSESEEDCDPWKKAKSLIIAANKTLESLDKALTELNTTAEDLLGNLYVAAADGLKQFNTTCQDAAQTAASTGVLPDDLYTQVVQNCELPCAKVDELWEMVNGMMNKIVAEIFVAHTTLPVLYAGTDAMLAIIEKYEKGSLKEAEAMAETLARRASAI